MAKLRRLSWVDITLVIILVIGVLVTRSALQTKTNLEQEKTSLENSRRAAEVTVSTAGQAIDLESLRQSVEQARSALAESTLPAEFDAIAVTAQILKSAKESNVTINRWDSSYTSASLNGRSYSAIRHGLSVEGNAESLIKFSKDLTLASIAPVVPKISMARVDGEGNLLQVELELLVYYR